MASLFRQMAGQARGGKEKTQEKILVSSEEREIGSLGKVAAASFFVEPSLCEFAAAAVCGTFHCKKNFVWLPKKHLSHMHKSCSMH